MARALTPEELRRRTRLSLGLALVALLAVGLLARLGGGREHARELVAPERARARAERAAPAVQLAQATAQAHEAGREALASPPPAALRARSTRADADEGAALAHLVVRFDSDGEAQVAGTLELGRTDLEIERVVDGARYVRRVEGTEAEAALAGELTRQVRAGRAEAWLEPGSWRLRLLDEGGAACMLAAQDGRVHELAQVELRPREERELVLTVRVRAAFHGRVLGAKDGAPIPNAEVWSLALGREQGVRTDGSGRFRIDAVPLGKGSASELVAAAEGWAPALARGNAQQQIELRLAPAKSIRASVACDGDPRAVRVSLSGESLGPARAAGLELGLGYDGGLRLDGLRADVRHLLVLVADGHARYTRFVEPASGVVDLGLIALEREARLVGSVHRRGDAKRAFVVSLTSLELRPGETDARGRLGGMLRATTGDDERFELTHLSPGRYRLEVHDGKGLAHREELVLEPGTTTRAIEAH